MKPILVLGSINVDLINYVAQMPSKGETIFSLDFKKSPGGKGNNLASALTDFGVEVNLLGTIGQDDNGKYIKEQMLKKGLSTKYIIEMPNEKTGVAYITVDSIGDNVIIVDSGANKCLNSSHVTNEILKEHSLVCISLENPIELILDVFARARSLNVVTLLNYSPSCKVPRHLFDLVDIFISNKREFDKISQFYEIRDPASFQQTFNNKMVVVTLGKSGVSFSQNCKEILTPGFIIDGVVDTAGAGDFFLAAFLAAYCKGYDLPEAIDFGQKGGALKVTLKGAQQSLSYNDILALSLKRRAF